MNRLQTYLHRLKRKKGYSLIELVIVVAIIAILTLMATGSFGGSTEKANKAKILADMDLIVTAENKYYADNTAWSTASNPITKSNVNAYCDAMKRYIYKCPKIPHADGKYTIKRDKADFNITYESSARNVKIKYKE